MVTMTYNGKHRTVRRGPRVYVLKPGTYEVPADDVDALTEVGARVKSDDDDAGADATPTPDEGQE